MSLLSGSTLSYAAKCHVSECKREQTGTRKQQQKTRKLKARNSTSDRSRDVGKLFIRHRTGLHLVVIAVLFALLRSTASQATISTTIYEQGTKSTKIVIIRNHRRAIIVQCKRVNTCSKSLTEAYSDFVRSNRADFISVFSSLNCFFNKKSKLTDNKEQTYSCLTSS